MSILDEIAALRKAHSECHDIPPIRLHIGTRKYDELRAHVQTDPVGKKPEPGFTGIRIYIDRDNPDRMEFS